MSGHLGPRARFCSDGWAPREGKGVSDDGDEEPRDADGHRWLSGEELKRLEQAAMFRRSPTCIWCRENPTLNIEEEVILDLVGACRECRDYYRLVRQGRVDLAARK